MARTSEKQLFRRWIDCYEAQTGAAEFLNLLESAAEDALGMSQEDAARYAVGSAGRMWNILRQKMSEDEQRGLTSLLTVRDSQARLLWYRPTAGDKPKEPLLGWAGVRSRARPHLVRAIEGLTSREYEALACMMCKAMGAKHTLLTPPGDEGGIDFLALVPSGAGNNHLLGGSRGALRVVGQCKLYSDRVSVSHVREFTATLTNVRHLHRDVERHIPAWFRAANGPIVGMIVGHRGFQAGAVSMAREHGIVLGDSLDVAEILAMSRWRRELGAEERATALPDEVRRELEAEAA